MEFQELWRRCLQMIAEKVSEHTFDTWFKDIALERYDPEQKAVLLSVPHRYVYEYLEEVQARLLKQSLDAAFGADVRLSYRIARPAAPASGGVLDGSPAATEGTAPQIPQFSIANARERLEAGLRHYLGEKMQWLPAYDKVADWLSDNKGRGLLCFGTSGLGKTVICCDILPWFFGKNNVISVPAMQMGQRIDELLKARCVIIDDLGHEAVQETVNYKRRTPFYELCDAAERRGILLVITTNLSTTAVQSNSLYSSSIQERYGADVISRLRATTRAVKFEGADLRR